MKTTERRQQLKDRLIQIAEETIEADGLAGLKARDLAKQAECALGAIYNVFPDMDALILEVNWRTLAAFEIHITDETVGHEQEEAVSALKRLARVYIDFAAENPKRWRTLFEHRMAEGRPLPDWYVAAQARLFSHVEAPLRRILPDLRPEDCATLARTLFSAVHGMVSLGLDEKLTAMKLPLLHEQVAQVTDAMARGLRLQGMPGL